MKVWIVCAICGDYYCGCDNHAANEGLGSHLIGVYTSEAKALEALAAAKVAEHSFANHAEPRRTWKKWSDPGIREIETDVMPEPLEVWS